MATKVDAAGAAHAPLRGFMADQAFFARYSIFIALFIIASFAQFSLCDRGSLTLPHCRTGAVRV